VLLGVLVALTIKLFIRKPSAKLNLWNKPECPWIP